MTDPIKLQPGPELVSLVAEEVMEWEHDYSLSQTHAEDWQQDGKRVAGPDWRPDLDIAAAWEVIVAVYTKTGHWILVSPFGSKWVAYQKTACADEDYGCFCEYASTAPHAICLAARAAVRAGKEVVE